jgi:spermidine/putrescine ABC transporter ATP-binding subunit
MKFLEIDNLRKSYSANQVVKHFEIAVERGEFISFLGPSGCGKTTCLRMIAGFETPTHGSIKVNGKDITHLSPNQRDIGMVFQSYALFPNMTVAQNVVFGLKVAKKPAAEIKSRLAEMLDLIKLPHLADRYPYQLSGGQQQRVALARAIAGKPQLLLLDEPLSALDAKIRVSLREEIRALQRALGITTIFVTHDQEEALTMSDRIAVMSHGKILQIGTANQIYEHPVDRFVADFIGETNFIEAEVILRIGNQGQIRLPSGLQIKHELDPVAAVGGKVTLAIRPERIDLVKPGTDCQLSGKVENIVYFGTDTHFHIDLDTGGDVTVRVQNRRGFQEVLKQGDTVGLRIAPEAMQVLKD